MRSLYHILLGVLYFLLAFVGIFIVMAISDSETPIAVYFILAIPFLLLLLGIKKTHNKLHKLEQPTGIIAPPVEVPITKEQKPKNGMSGSAYEEFLQLVKLSLKSNSFGYEEAVLLRNFLRRTNGYKDRRTRKLSNLFKEVLSKNSLSQADSIRLVQSLHAFLGSKAPPLTSEHKAILKQQEENIKSAQARKKNQSTKKSKKQTKQWSDNKRRDFYEVIDEYDLTIGNTYQILYTDYHGNTTEREIILLGIEHNQRGDLLLEARCKLRDSVRTFKVRNIDEMVDIETGEVLI